MWWSLALWIAAPLPTDFPPIPAELVPFLRQVVQQRAAEGLNRVVEDRNDPKYGTVYGGAPEDANIAWIAATAYRYPWSRFHGDAALAEKAFFLLDSLARIHADGRWDDGGLNAYFGLQSFAWAVLEWLETGAVDEARAALWRAAVAAAADDAMAVLQGSIYAGDYANPEFYYLSGLAAAWRITGDERYRKEAAAALRRYDDSLFDGGGVSYFLKSSPQHGYQQMVTKSVALYGSLTGDEHALAWLRKLAEYYPRVQHRSGLLPDAEQPHLKHALYNPVNPAVPALLAAILDDGANRYCADVAARLRADNVANRLPSFLAQNPNWYNYQNATYAAAALRLMEDRPLPEPVAPPARASYVDGGFRGVRSHWDDFTAAVGTRRMNDTLAGAYLADTTEPMLPLGAALDGVLCEVLEGPHGEDAPAEVRMRASRRCVEWDPGVHHVTTAPFKAVSCLTWLCAPYWGDRPWIPGERWRLNEVAGWTTIQHWAVWRDHLIGLAALTCHADGGDPATADLARILWRLAPIGRARSIDEQTPERWSVRYGGLALTLERLAEQGGFGFSVDASAAPPRADWAPQIAKAGPWKAGDRVFVATDARPESADAEVRFRGLAEGAAALAIEPEGTVGWLWIGNLVRHWRRYQAILPAGITVTVYKGDVTLTQPAPGAPCHVPLGGAESAVLRLEGEAPLDAEAILAGLGDGWGRGEARPARP